MTLRCRMLEIENARLGVTTFQVSTEKVESRQSFQ